MKKMNRNENLIQIIDCISKLNSQDVNKLKNIIKFQNELRNEIVHHNFNIKNQIIHSNPLTRINGKLDRTKVELIGGLPSILLSKKYFPRNEIIAEFAKKNLSIDIRHAGKRSRPEIIGLVITGIAQMESNNAIKIKEAINQILGKFERGEIKDFFSEWDKAIKNIEFRR